MLELLPKLQGVLNASDLGLVKQSVTIRFNDPQGEISCKESLILYEQKLLPEPQIRAMLEEAYGFKFPEIRRPFVTADVQDLVKKYKNIVPLSMDSLESKIYVGVLPENKGKNRYLRTIGAFDIVEMPVTLYDFVRIYTDCWGAPDFLRGYPVADLFNYITSEAIALGASDITISEKETDVNVYYNIARRKVPSSRLFYKAQMGDLHTLITSKGMATSSFANNQTIYLSIDLDSTHRGRVVLNRTYYGWTVTIRILSNRSMSIKLKELNLPDEAITFLRTRVLNQTAGLKLFAGPTMSGKNTTILSGLYEYHRSVDCKMVSVEQPVEILANFIEQINCDNEDNYARAVDSLLRQNPDIIYITEMTERTALGAMKTANTGKPVFSTIHANRVAEVFSRIQDISGLPLSQIIQTLDCVFFQQLVPKRCPKCNDEGCPDCYKAGMLPIVEYYQFGPAVKRDLVGKSLSEVYNSVVTYVGSNTKESYARTLLDSGQISRKTYENYLGAIL